jgi:two-component system chemotaxis sensor kinase CheA
MANTQDYCLLLVDDDQDFLDVLTDFARNTGFQLITANSAKAALSVIKARHHEIAMVISDFQMGEMDGLQLRRALLPDHRDIPFAILSGYVTREHALEAVDLKICSFMEKPPNMADVEKMILKETAERIAALNEKHTLETMFVTESTTILEEIEPLILSLESDPNDIDTMNTIFRLVHTIKGSSGVLDSDVIYRFAHRFEDLLSKLKAGAMQVTPDIVTALLRGFDVVGAMIAAVADRRLGQFDVEALTAIFVPQQTAPQARIEGEEEVSNQTGVRDHPAEKNAKKATSNDRDVIRVPIATLDEFMELSGEITVIRNMVNRLVRTIEKEHPGNRNIGHLGELLEEMHKVNAAMQNKIVDLRKVPLKNTFRPLPRTIRDLSKSLSKELQLNIEGEDLRVDTTISQTLSESLIHVIRNAADHGLETTKDRAAAGKPQVGTVTIQCREAREEVVIEIADDGRGIDPRKVSAKALEKGLVTSEDLARMTENQIMSLIFEPGFSTAAAVTDVSGRGVGMDMVRTSVEKLRGRVAIDSKIGRGTRFTLHMPIPKSVLIINSLLVRAGDHAFAVPQDNIIRLLRLSPVRHGEMIRELEGASLLLQDDRYLPIIELRQVLGLKASEQSSRSDETCIAVLKSDQLTYALRVDDILDSEEIVVKPLGRFFQNLQVYSGATFFGEGGVGLILDVKGVGAMGGLSKAAEARAVEVRRDAKSLETKVEHDRDLLLFELERDGIYALPLQQIYRMEEVKERDVKVSGDKDVLIYREQLAPIIALMNALGFERKTKKGSPVTLQSDVGQLTRQILMVHFGDRFFGLEISRILDIAQPTSEIDRYLKDRQGILGSVFVGDQSVTVIDAPELLSSVGFSLPPIRETRLGGTSPDVLANVVPLKGVPPVDARASGPQALKASGDHSEGSEGWGLF